MTETDLPPAVTDTDPRIVQAQNGPFAHRIASTMWAPGMAAWSGVTVVRPPSPWRLLRAARSHDAIIINGSARLRSAQFPGMALVGGLLRHGPQVVIAEASWEPGIKRLSGLGGSGRALGDRLMRGMVRAMDNPRATYCVLSREELEIVPRLWGISADRVRFTPYHFALWGMDADEPQQDTEPYLFAGGTPLRDYGTLLEAARDLPWPLRIATTSPIGPIPSNVEVGQVEHARYMRLMRDAAAVVVPLAASSARSAGHQTYLNAMALGKPVIVTDVIGVRDYVVDGRTGIIVPSGEPAAMREALVDVMEGFGSARLRALGDQARRVAHAHFSPASYWSRLRALAEERAALRALP